MPPSRGSSSVLFHGMRPSVAAAHGMARRSIAHPQSRSFVIGRTAGLPLSLRPRPTTTRPSTLSRFAQPVQSRFQSNHASSFPPDPQSSSLQSPPSEDFYGLEPPPADFLAQGDDRHVGFLAENYGIDFGYGTSSIVKAVFEAVHSTGPEFWVSVLVTGFLLRLAISPMNRLVSEESAKMAAMKHITGPIQDRIRNAAIDKNMTEMTQLRAQQKQIYKDAGIKPWRVAFNFPQIIVGFGCWRTFRNMADVHVDGLDTGGVFWFPDLTVPDPTFIIPIATAALQYLTFKANVQDSPELSKGQRAVQSLIGNVLPGFFLIIIMWAPSIVQLHFLTTTSFSGLMSFAFRSKSIRAFLRMTPRVNPSTGGKPNGGSVVNTTATSKPTTSKKPSAAPKPPSVAPEESIFSRMRRTAADKYIEGRKKLVDGANEATGNRFTTTMQEKAKQNRQTKANQHEQKRAAEIRKDREWYESRTRTSRRHR